MCDNERLLDYLYGELGPAERETFDRHLTSCADCRSEVEGLRSTRGHLALWAPPEPDLGFQIVRSAKPAARVAASWWRPAPVWGLAAAALLVLSVSAAVANLEVTVGTGGVTVRTGWNRAPQAAASTATAPSSTQMERLEAKVKNLEGQLAARPVTTSAAAVTPVVLDGATVRMSDQELQRFIRQQINASEERQRSELAIRILQVSRDVEANRRVDLARISQGFTQVQNAAAESSRWQRGVEDIIRVGFQR
jgi:anti-sigma factor RsiW